MQPLFLLLSAKYKEDSKRVALIYIADGNIIVPMDLMIVLLDWRSL